MNPLGFLTIEEAFRKCDVCDDFLGGKYWYCPEDHRFCLKCREAKGLHKCNKCPTHPTLKKREWDGSYA